MGEQAQPAEAVRSQIRDETRSALTETDDGTELPALDPDAAARLHDLSPITGTVVEHYWARNPFAHTAIVEDEDGERQYIRVEPAMDALDRDLRQDIATTIRERLLDAGLDRDDTDREIRRRFPDALGVIAEAVDNGVPVTEAFALVADRTGGELADELARVQRDVSWTGEFTDALLRFARRVDVPQITRTTQLLSESARATDDLGPVF